ncbi:hypothetical protein Tco_1533317 [Tanacetum coccineum]
MNGKDPSKRGFGFGSFCRCKKMVECVACLLGRWNGSRGTGAEKTSGRKSMQWALSSVRVAGIRRRQEENGEATRCEHCGGGSSNRVALDVVGEEVVSPEKVKDRILSEDAHCLKESIQIPQTQASYIVSKELKIDATVIDATVSLLKTEFVNKFQESAKRIFPLCKSYLLINEFVESRSQIKCGLVNHAFAAALLSYCEFSLLEFLAVLNHRYYIIA